MKTVKLGECVILIQFYIHYQGCLKILMDLNIKNPDYFSLSGYQQLDITLTGNSESHTNTVAHKFRLFLKAIEKRKMCVVDNIDDELYKSGHFSNILF